MAPVILVCLGFALLGPASVWAAPTWLSPASLSESGTPEDPDVAVDAAGDVIAVWSSFNGLTRAVQAATRPAGGSWGAPVQLSEQGEEAGLPRVSVNSQGYAVAVWRTGEIAHAVVKAAVRPTAAGAWSAAVELGQGGYATPEQQVAIDSSGKAVVAWISQLENPGVAHLETAFHEPGGAWSAPVAISGTKSPGQPRLAVDSRGDFTAIWGGFNVIESAELPTGASGWNAPSVLTELDTGSPALAADPAGDVVASWIYAISSSERLIEGAAKPAGGSWGAPVTLSPVREAVGEPDVAIDSAGDGVAIWSASGPGGGNPVVLAAFKPVSGTWQPPTELAEGITPEIAARVAFTSQEQALAVWWGVAGADNAIESSVGDLAGAGWQPAVPISGAVPYSSQPRIGVDGQGDAVAIWELGYGFGSSVIQAAGYDAAGPQLGTPSIPSSGVAGEPVSFSVSPLDVWSALGATSWNFGDETAATGTNVTHTYSKAGVYRVTIAAADVLGNSTSVTGAIAITRHPPTPPTITRARESAATWREGDKLASISRQRRPRVGTTFSLTLDQDATLSFAFSRWVEGRKVKGRCLARTRRNGHKRPCGRAVPAGVLSFHAHSGSHKVFFEGRLSHSKQLPRGAYTVKITASNAEGRSTPRQLRFRIVK